MKQSQNNIFKVVEELEFDVEISSLFLGAFDLLQQKVNISFSGEEALTQPFLVKVQISTFTRSFDINAEISRIVHRRIAAYFAFPQENGLVK